MSVICSATAEQVPKTLQVLPLQSPSSEDEASSLKAPHETAQQLNSPIEINCVDIASNAGFKARVETNIANMRAIDFI